MKMMGSHITAQSEKDAEPRNVAIMAFPIFPDVSSPQTPDGGMGWRP
jgi:hypothetical protein